MKPHTILIVFLIAFFFILPIHFFILGEGYGYGIQGFTYRYQITSQGTSFFPVSYELGYILDKTITGRTAWSIGFWILGTLLYSSGMLVYLLSYDGYRSIWVRRAAGLLCASIISVVISSLIQYGVFFHGAAGISILIGIPILIGITYWMYILPDDKREQGS